MLARAGVETVLGVGYCADMLCFCGLVLLGELLCELWLHGWDWAHGGS